MVRYWCSRFLLFLLCDVGFVFVWVFGVDVFVYGGGMVVLCVGMMFGDVWEFVVCVVVVWVLVVVVGWCGVGVVVCFVLVLRWYVVCLFVIVLFVWLV